MATINTLAPDVGRASIHITDIADRSVGYAETRNDRQDQGAPKGTTRASARKGKDRLVGPFSLRVLASIQKLGDRAWGANLQRYLSEMLERDVAIGQLYLALSKLAEQGLISFRHTEPEPVQGGRSKKVFQLEALGAQVLGNAAVELSA